MYQIVTETIVNGKRCLDSLSTKLYAKKGNAERVAKNRCYTTISPTGETVEYHSYVRGILTTVTVEEAKAAYRRCQHVWIMGKYGNVMLTPSGYYGSHASQDELFWRSVHTVAPVYDYVGDFYIESV